MKGEAGRPVSWQFAWFTSIDFPWTPEHCYRTGGKLWPWRSRLALVLTWLVCRFAFGSFRAFVFSHPLRAREAIMSGLWLVFATFGGWECPPLWESPCPIVPLQSSPLVAPSNLSMTPQRQRKKMVLGPVVGLFLAPSMFGSFAF